MTATQATPQKGHRRGDWRPAFLDAFRASGNVRASCEAAGVDRSRPYKERDRNPTFAAAWLTAEQDAVDLLGLTARKRALASSDTLMIFLLKSLRPERYRESIRIDVRREAERIATELGVDVEAAIAEAERILAETSR